MLIWRLSYAQQAVIGNISDDSNNSPLEGVIVKVKATDISTLSDANGNYSIEIPTAKKILIFQKEGYLVKEIEIVSNITNVKMTGTLEELFNLTIDELLNLCITTSSKKEESLKETPAYVIVLTSSEIDALNFTSLEEVVNYITGLSTLTANGNTYTTTASRGNSSPLYDVNNLLLFDGIPLYNMYHGSYDYNFIPLSSIKQIEVVKGSNSVLYGTNAMINVINIIPKENAEGENSFSGRIKYGSYNTISGQGTLVGQKENIRFGIFSDINMSEGEELTYFHRTDGSEFDFQRVKKAGSIAGYAEYRGFKLNILSVNRQYKSLFNTALDTLLFNSGENVFSIPYANNVDEFQNMFSLSYSNDITDQFGVRIRGSYQNYLQLRSYRQNIRKFTTEGFFNEAELMWTPNERLSTIIGVHFNHYDASRYTENIKNGVKTRKTDVNPNELKTNDFAFYINGDYKLLEKLKVFYGTRYYMMDYDGNTNDNISPRLALGYEINDNLSCKAIYGYSFRAPTYFEKSVDALAVGRPDLKPEISISYDLVFSGSFKKFQFNIDLFYNQIMEKIVELTPTPEDLEKYGSNRLFILSNADELDLYGAEISGKFYLSDKLKSFFGYAYAQAENPNNNPDNIGDDPWYYEHLFNCGLSYRPIKFVEFNASSRIISEWATAPENAVFNLGINIYPKKNYPFCLELKAENIFEEEVYMPESTVRDVTTVPYTPQTQNRRFYAGLSYRF